MHDTVDTATAQHAFLLRRFEIRRMFHVHRLGIKKNAVEEGRFDVATEQTFVPVHYQCKISDPIPSLLAFAVFPLLFFLPERTVLAYYYS
jgi:hypothetical protein